MAGRRTAGRGRRTEGDRGDPRPPRASFAPLPAAQPSTPRHGEQAPRPFLAPP